MQQRPAWWGGVLPTVLLPLALVPFTVGGSAAASNFMPGFRPFDGWAVALLLVGPVSLVFRRANPPVALGVTAAATVAYLLAGYAFGPVFLPLLVALGSAVAAGYRRAAYPIIGATFATVLISQLLRTDGATAVWTGGAFWLAVVAAVIGIGEVVRARRDRQAQTQAMQAETEQRRGMQERLRIAQELHDVLGHHVSLINIQAGVALYLLDDDPHQVRESLEAIKQSSRDLLREMRSTLGVLRAVDEPPPHHPVPGLDRLDALADDVRAAGLPVEIEVRGTQRELPPSVDLAAYRIVQEALTNVRKHAGTARAHVLVEYGARELNVQVDDDGAGADAPVADGGGNGLPGMRERASALGGSMQAGRRTEGGFRVRASLPTPPEGDV